MALRKRNKSENTSTTHDSVEVTVAELASSSHSLEPKPKSIDSNLSLLAQQIEKLNSHLSVLAARQFRYKLLQTPVEVLVSLPRKFNVLEEFILRASIEFTTPTTVKELANVLGLDLIFVQSTAENLENLKILKVLPTGEIKMTSQGRNFYKQGSVSLPPQPKRIYAIADPFQENLTFQFETLSEELTDLPELTDFVPIENNLPQINNLTLTDIQQLIQASGLGLHVPDDGKVLTHFHVTGPSQDCWRKISIFVLFDAVENKYTILARQDRQILEKASTLLTELQAQQKVFFNDLCGSIPEVNDSLKQVVSQSQPVPQTKPKRNRKNIISLND